MAPVLSIYVAPDMNAEPALVLHLHPDAAVPDLVALALRLGTLAMAEAGKPPWFPTGDALPQRDGAHAGPPATSPANTGGRSK